MTSSQESYVEKINKLLRKAESTTPEEAELLFAKATELMAKYAIDEAMLNVGRDKKNDPIEVREYVTVGIYRHALYWVDVHVLRVCGCQVVETTGSPWRTIGGRTFKQTRVLKAVGYRSDLDHAEMLLTSLKLQAMRAENVWWTEHQDLYRSYGKGQQHAARRGFMKSFADGANKKMQEATARGRAQAEKEHTKDSVALVLRDKSLAVQDEFEKQFPNTVTGRRSRMSAGDAFARSHGYEAGQRADVGQPAFGGKKKELNK